MRERYGIIFVHGIVGNNHIFDFLAPLVPENYESRFINLNGHGGDALAFSRTSMAEWKAQIEAAVSEMKTRCDHILAVGHSMGSLLIMEEATKGNLTRLFLLNPPLHISLRVSLLANIVKVAIGRTSDSVAQAAKDAYGITLDFNPLHYYGWPSRYLELFKEIRRVRKSVLPDIHCPVRALLSAYDEMVSPSSSKELSNIGDISIITLPESTHYYYSPADRKAIMKEFEYFITESPV